MMCVWCGVTANNYTIHPMASDGMLCHASYCTDCSKTYPNIKRKRMANFTLVKENREGQYWLVAYPVFMKEVLK